jgi:phenylpropionate dioxygenase-like ring-hydroxylating dioxygenase large terminal subunit
VLQNRPQPKARVQVATEELSLPVNGTIPRLSGDIRPLVPKLGLRNYWYPALGARRVGRRRPVKVTMCGEDLCFFRGKRGHVVAIQDVCPHRGARLSEGDCHYKGTVACPYHGWVYDEHGRNVACLSEGPDSTVCGKPGTEAKVFPTRTLKGVVFVWIGDEAPAPIEEDVPEEFFDKDAYILFNDRIMWKTNWEVGLENSMDSHVNYLHRDNLQALLASPTYAARMAQGRNPVYTGNGFRASGPGGGFPLTPPPAQDIYPNGWKWPKHRYRRLWWWMFNPFLRFTRVPAPETKTERWSGGHRLPGMFRATGPLPNKPGGGRPPVRRGGGGGLFGLYTRQTVPVEEWLTRVWYFHYTRPKGLLDKLRYNILYFGLYRWLVEYNFSQQDMSVMLRQRYDWPEKLSGTDAEVIQWRKLVVTKHYGGRNARFEVKGAGEVDPTGTPIAVEMSD